MNFRTMKQVEENKETLRHELFELLKKPENKSRFNMMKDDLQTIKDVNVFLIKNYKSNRRDGAHDPRKRNSGRKLRKMYDSIEIRTYDSFWKDYRTLAIFFSVKDFKNWMEEL